LIAWEDWEVFKKILVGFLLVVCALFGIIALQPSDYRVVRSASITAPPETVFGLVNDFRKWESWSPWEKLDPNMKRTFEGSPSGEGAKYGWTGNSDVGEGKMTILESKPGEMVRIQLDFIAPFESTATNEFVFKPEGGGTHVDWVMTGSNNLMSKAMCLFMGGMDKMIGPDFEKGLAQMKSAAEAAR